MMGNREDAQDCAQEALLRAYRAFDSFRGQSSAKTWLYRIAYNACLDFLRKRKDMASLDALREAGFDPADSRMPQPGDRLERQELRRQIEYALTLLPEDQRAAMILRDFQGLSYQEIASVLSLSEGTGKSRLSRAREKVKNILMEMEQNDGLSVQKGEGRQK
jgi:RNA polymerase sigma-70 factor (ECF subfamily)